MFLALFRLVGVLVVAGLVNVSLQRSILASF